MNKFAVVTLLSLLVVGCGDDAGNNTSTGQNGGQNSSPNGSTANGSTANGTTNSSTNATTNATTNSESPGTEPVVATDDVLAVSPDGGVLDVLENDIDPDGQALSVTAVTDPEHGSVSLVDGVLTYTPPPRTNGLDTFTFTVEDPHSSATATVFVTTYDSHETGAPAVELPEPPGISGDELAVVINTADPYSVAVGEYYATARGIASDAVIRVELPTENRISRDAFEPIYQEIVDATPERIQAYALAWIAPYRVDCMSMTSAIALGFDEQYCGIGSGCQPSAPIDYYDSNSDAPFSDHEVRPAMMLALGSEADGTALVDRGVAADRTFPAETGYLFRTTDTARSVRYPDLATLPEYWETRGLALDYIDNSDGSGSNTLTDATDVLFYFTGLTSVGGLDSLTFKPGAVGDHLTSFGGRLTATSGQMPATRFLEAGATGSYGTVVEPCNYQQKFPRVSVFLDHYFRGETLVEAYWKSVNWPGEGVFIGEPLARPYGRAFLEHGADGLAIRLSWLTPGTTYQLVGSESAEGPWESVGEPIAPATVGLQSIEVSPVEHTFYRIETTN